MTIHFTCKLKSIAPAGRAKFYISVDEALYTGQTSVYWDGQKMTEDTTPKGRPRPIEATLELSRNQDGPQPAYEFTWTDPARTTRFRLPAECSFEDARFVFLLILAHVLQEENCLSLIPDQNGKIHLDYRHRPVSFVNSIHALRLLAQTNRITDALTEQQKPLEERKELETEIQGPWILRDAVLDEEDTLSSYDDLLNDSEYPQFRNAEKSWLEAAGQSRFPDFPYSTAQSLHAESLEALLELLLFLTGKQLNDETEFEPVFDACFKGSIDDLDLILESDEPLPGLSLDDLRTGLEFAYLEWMVNLINSALTTQYCADFCDALMSYEYKFDPDHPELEVLRKRISLRVLHYHILNSSALIPQILGYLFLPIIFEYPEEEIQSLTNLLLYFSPLISVGMDEIENALSSDEEWLSQTPGEMFTRLVGTLYEKLDEMESFDSIDLPLLAAGTCGMLKVTPPSARIQMSSVCEKVVNALSKEIFASPWPDLALVTAFTDLVLIIGYIDETPNGTIDRKSLHQTILKTLTSLVERELVFSPAVLTALMIYLYTFLDEWPKKRASYYVELVFELLRNRPALLDPAILPPLHFLIDTAYEKNEVFFINPYFRYAQLAREAFYLHDSEFLMRGLEALQSVAVQAMHAEANKLAESIFDELVPVVDEANQIAQSLAFPDEPFNPLIGLEAERIELFTYAAANALTLSSSEAPRLMINIIALLGAWNPDLKEDEKDFLFQAEASLLTAKLFVRSGARQAATNLAADCRRMLLHYHETHKVTPSTQSLVLGADYMLAFLSYLEHEYDDCFKAASDYMYSVATADLSEDANETIADPVRDLDILHLLIATAKGKRKIEEYNAVIVPFFNIALPGGPHSAPIYHSFLEVLNEAKKHRKPKQILKLAENYLDFLDEDYDSGLSMMRIPAVHAKLTALLQLNRYDDLTNSIFDEFSSFIVAIEEFSDTLPDPTDLLLTEAADQELMTRRPHSSSCFSGFPIDTLAVCQVERALTSSIHDAYDELIRSYFFSDTDWKNLQKKLLISEDLQSAQEDILDLGARCTAIQENLSDLSVDCSDQASHIYDLASLLEKKCGIHLPYMKAIVTICGQINAASCRSLDSADALFSQVFTSNENLEAFQIDPVFKNKVHLLTLAFHMVMGRIGGRLFSPVLDQGLPTFTTTDSSPIRWRITQLELLGRLSDLSNQKYRGSLKARKEALAVCLKLYESIASKCTLNDILLIYSLARALSSSLVEHIAFKNRAPLMHDIDVLLARIRKDLFTFVPGPFPN